MQHGIRLHAHVQHSTTTTVPSTEPLPPAGLAALKRLEQALKAVTA